MFGYVVLGLCALLLGRLVLASLRSARPAEVKPGDAVEPGTLRTVALLTGPSFDDDPGDDPQSMGEPLARALCEGLRARGYDPGEPFAASHGFELEVPQDGSSLSVSCGLRDGEEEDGTNEWLVFVTQTTSSRDPTPAANTANARKLVGSLVEIFATIEGLRRVRWHAYDEAFLRGKESWCEGPF